MPSLFILNVAGEVVERERRSPDAAYQFCQVDETAYSVRKHHRGRRVRKSGVQWALTMVFVERRDDGKLKAIGADARLVTVLNIIYFFMDDFKFTL